MNAEPNWVTVEAVLAFHESQLARFGGGPGLRDRGLLESAVTRPQNQYHYAGETSLARLAAAYGFGIARNHPFVDGNKRAAFLAAYTFLALNDLRFSAPQPDVVLRILALAAGELSESDLAQWIETNIRHRP